MSRGTRHSPPLGRIRPERKLFQVRRSGPFRKGGDDGETGTWRCDESRPFLQVDFWSKRITSKRELMKTQRIAFVLVLTHLWALMVFLGAILFVTTVLYPNIFYDIPGSL